MRLRIDLLCFVALIAAVCGHGDHPLAAIQPHRVSFDEQSSVSVIASPRQLSRSGEWVWVEFSGVAKPSLNDWIGVYSPDTTDVTLRSPIKYKWANSSTTYLSTGAGSLNFRLINMRQNYIFVFFTNGTASPVVSGRSNPVTFADPNEPLQPHLAYTGDVTQMRLMWTTLNAKQPTVWYGESSGVYSRSVPAKSSTYTVDQMCGPPAATTGWREPGTLHNAIMTDLIPGRRYYYVFGDASAPANSLAGRSAEFSFEAAQLADPTKSIDFFVFGDLGAVDVDGSAGGRWQIDSSLNTTIALTDDFSDQKFVLHIGDISYAVGYAAQWELWFDQIKSLSPRLPWMTCPGNHERDYPSSGSYFTGTDSGGECGTPYEHRLLMPVPQYDQPWYSFNSGPVHVIMTSTEHDFSRGSPQFNFIVSDLAAVDRSKTPWVVFNGHRPMYLDSTYNTVPNGDIPISVFMRAELEDVFMKYEVDVAFWGHHHSWQRTCPVYNETCMDAKPSNEYLAPVHIVTGAAGFRSSTTFMPNTPHWIRYESGMTHGYARVSATSTSLRVQYVSGLSRVVLDDMTLKLPASRQPKLA